MTTCNRKLTLSGAEVIPRTCRECGLGSCRHGLDVSPWHPMTDPVALKHLGKLGEEVNELGAATMRCIVQGIGESEPVTGKANKQWLEEEIADVLANIKLNQEHFRLDMEFIEQRAEMKYQRLKKWHAGAAG